MMFDRWVRKVMFAFVALVLAFVVFWLVSMRILPDWMVSIYSDIRSLKDGVFVICTGQQNEKRVATEGQIRRLREIMRDLPAGTVYVDASAPDYILRLDGADNKERYTYSFYLKEGYVYNGDFLDAKFDGMIGRRSVVFKLSANQCVELEKVFNANGGRTQSQDEGEG